jgi:hypothetical protein
MENNGFQTVPLTSDEAFPYVASSVNWGIEKRPAIGLWTLTKLAGVALLFMASPSSVMIADPWLQERRRETSTVLGMAVYAPRRRMSVAEARSVALAILYESEARRIRFAEEEARRSAVWEEQQ